MTNAKNKKKTTTNILPLFVVPTAAPYSRLQKMYKIHYTIKALHYECSIVYIRCRIHNKIKEHLLLTPGFNNKNTI